MALLIQTKYLGRRGPCPSRTNKDAAEERGTEKSPKPHLIAEADAQIGRPLVAQIIPLTDSGASFSTCRAGFNQPPLGPVPLLPSAAS